MKTFCLFLSLFLVLFAFTGLADAQASTCAQESGGVLTTTLAWNDTDTIDPVGILRSQTSGGPYAQVGSAPAGSLSYTDTVPMPTASSITYYYVVENQSPASGNSPNSNEVCKTFFAIPPAPTNLTGK